MLNLFQSLGFSHLFLPTTLFVALPVPELLIMFFALSSGLALLLFVGSNAQWNENVR